ncbi:MAG: TonB-dependent receptor plug domain-containing protein [Flavobacteriaceae bacterium]|nr:TonB-dependent receptor plug domain-containing protein [Flavobacteriaceae bacterium]
MRKFFALFMLSFVVCQLHAQEVPTLTVGGEKQRIKSLDMNVTLIGNKARTTYDVLYFSPTTKSNSGELSVALRPDQVLAGLAFDLTGTFQDAVVVENQQGGVFTNAVLRKGDQAIKITQSGSSYRAVIPEISSKGLHHVKLSVDENLSAYNMNLPLRFNDKLDKFSIQINVLDQKGEPSINTTKLEGLKFVKTGANYVLTHSDREVLLNTSLNIQVPVQIGDEKVATYEDYGLIYKALSTKSRIRPGAKSVDLYWDVSYSMRDRDLTKELQLLDEYFSKTRNTKVNLIQFSNAVVKEDSFQISGGDWSQLKSALKASVYDGGTSFDKLFTNSKGDEILLFTDGMRNLSELKATSDKPHYIINSMGMANNKRLEDIAASTNGVYANLNNKSVSDAISAIMNQSYSFLGYHTSNDALEVIAEAAVSEDFSVVIKNLTKAETITLQFGYGNEVTDTYSIQVSPNQNTSGMAKTRFGQVKMTQVESEADRIAIAKATSVMTPETKLVVLNSAWDYVSYGITPPYHLNTAYRDVVRKTAGSKVVQNEEQIDTSFREKTVTGKVIDDEGMGIYGATVKVKYTSNAVITDDEGFFKINTKKGDVLSFSTLGYGSEEARVGDLNVINVAMGYDEEDEAGGSSGGFELDEVVVNTAGHIKRKDKALGFAAESLDADVIERKPIGDISRVLEGKASGVNITQTSGLSGSGTNVIIRGYSSINGNNQALFIVDGVPFSNDTNATGGAFAGLNGSSRSLDLDPNNIANITVLKGLAATTLYGSEGRNGVVLITTKTGRYGHNPEVRDALVYMHDVNLKLVNPDIKTAYMNELKDTKNVKDAYSTYLNQRESYMQQPAYFIDVFEYFKMVDEEIALRVLSNVAEIYTAETKYLKALAYKLEEQSQHKMSTFIYKQIATLNPKNVLVCRDLALAYQNLGDYKKSAEILEKVNQRIYDDEQAAKVLAPVLDKEYNNGKRLAKAAEHEYVKPYNDLRIVAEWNNDADINLRVIDPKLEECSFENEKTVIGGKIASSIQGPEEFSLKNAVKGDYYVHVDYNSAVTTEPTYLKVTMYKNYGSNQEEKEVKVIRLDNNYEAGMLAKVSF